MERLEVRDVQTVWGEGEVTVVLVWADAAVRHRRQRDEDAVARRADQMPAVRVQVGERLSVRAECVLARVEAARVRGKQRRSAAGEVGFDDLVVAGLIGDL